MANVGIEILDHEEQLLMFVTQLTHNVIVLGISWLRLHDIVVHLASDMVMFGSPYYMTHCHDRPVTVRRATEETWEPMCEEQPTGTANILKPRTIRGINFLLIGPLLSRSL
jgi:hypothetical protein